MWKDESFVVLYDCFHDESGQVDEINEQRLSVFFCLSFPFFHSKEMAEWMQNTNKDKLSFSLAFCFIVLSILKNERIHIKDILFTKLRWETSLSSKQSKACALDLTPNK